MPRRCSFKLELDFPQPLAGVDEAGCAPLAGPVVAAACILDRDKFPRGIDDSKNLPLEKREALYARIDARFDAMLKAGAQEEVAALATRNLDPLLPAMKAHGVPALIRHLNGEVTLDEAAEIGRADTRHYAKRQFTWFRHQLPEFEWVAPEAARGWLGAQVS